MFGLHYLKEIFVRLHACKLRTFFTGFGTLWSMLLLVLLQAAGAGYYSGTLKQLEAYGKNVLWIRPGYLSTGGRVDLPEEIADQLAKVTAGFERIVPILACTQQVVRGAAACRGRILGVPVGYEALTHLVLTEGALLSQRQCAEALPVCLLSAAEKGLLFGQETAVGRTVVLGGAVLSVVGVVESVGGGAEQAVVLSSSLFKQLFPDKSNALFSMVAALEPNADVVKIENFVRTYCGKQLGFQPTDESALWIYGSSKSSRLFQRFFAVLKGFVWFLGGCFLVGGMVHIGHTMAVVVQERTPELAVRKLLGASTRHIFGLVLLESLAITLFSGIFGMGVGLCIVRGANALFLPVFENYRIDRLVFQWQEACFALGALLVSGCLAGMLPAKRAIRITPTDALNNE